MNIAVQDTVALEIFARVSRTIGGQSRGRTIVLLFDYCRVRDKYFFLNRLADTRKDFLFVVVDGCFDAIHSIDSDNLIFIKPPKDIYFRPNQVQADESILSLITSDPTLSVAADIFYNLTRNFVENISPKDSLTNLGHVYHFTSKMMEAVNPHYILSWNQFHSHSRFVSKIAKSRKLPVGYLEHGLLPGSIQFDLAGQMGLSWITCEAECV